MYFPFAFHFNDIQCHKVKGTEHGDTKLVPEAGHIALDGEEDYVSVSNHPPHSPPVPLKKFLLTCVIRNKHNAILVLIGIML